MISKTARNALRAVLSVAEREASGPVSAKALARELDLPHNYLSKTLHRLVQHGPSPRRAAAAVATSSPCPQPS